MNKNKKNRNVLYFGVIVVMLGAIAFRWTQLLASNELPDFQFKTSDNELVKFSDFKNYNTVIVIINKRNAFIKSAIPEFIKKHDPGKDKLLLVGMNSEIPKKKGIYLINENEANAVKDLLNVNANQDNYYVIYDSFGYLRDKSILMANNKNKILGALGSKLAISNEYKDLLGLKVREAMKDSEKGIYLFSQRLLDSCKCYEIFEDLEAHLYEKGTKLKIRLLGSWTETEIKNLYYERNNRLDIAVGSNPIQQIFKEWIGKMNDQSLKFLVVNNGKTIYVFPLIDRNDYTIWSRFRETKFKLTYNVN